MSHLLGIWVQEAVPSPHTLLWELSCPCMKNPRRYSLWRHQRFSKSSGFALCHQCYWPLKFPCSREFHRFGTKASFLSDIPSTRGTCH